jgi:hypothetical protein
MLTDMGIHEGVAVMVVRFVAILLQLVEDAISLLSISYRQHLLLCQKSLHCKTFNKI